MAFKQKPPTMVVPDEPRNLLKTLTKRKIQDLLQHQGETLRRYYETALEVPDVAIQLPTGSGKTLVGLMIAEWRRRRFGERVLYLCPTKQLVHQVASQANEQYGLSVTPFVGSKDSYSPECKQQYKQGERVAISTCNALFNFKPYFDDADLIIVDDAHAAENYISGMWSLQISRIDHQPLFEAVAGVLRPHVGPTAFQRLSVDPGDRIDAGWVDKLPTPALLSISTELSSLLDSQIRDVGQRFAWLKLREHLTACHVYISPYEILIRPLLSPTWTHEAFAAPKQRVYMSATLGESGDLERLTGRSPIHRLPAPDGWDRQGIGRRFFVFPSYSLSPDETSALRLNLMKEAGRSLVAVPSDRSAKEVATQVREGLGFPVFSAGDIEESKADFVSTSNAVAIVANRYDGIDFPDDECRLLFVDGLPTATNLQERFLTSRMGAVALLNERIQTRVLQAIGRCTRSLTDRSAVVIVGEAVSDYLGDQKRRRNLHPELQAELAFGITQSRETTAGNFIENVKALIENSDDWEAADQEIYADRGNYTKELRLENPYLAASVASELHYMRLMWAGDFEGAYDAALVVLEKINSPSLQGYRALWQYLAGSAASLVTAEGQTDLSARARENYRRAKESARGGLPWLASLSRFVVDAERDDGTQAAVGRQIEKLEQKLFDLGLTSDKKFNALEIKIREGLSSSSAAQFESAQRDLGELLGLSAGKIESAGSPDPWWSHDNKCIVFEDFMPENEGGKLSVAKARQAADHPRWIRANIPDLEKAEILPVLVTSSKGAELGSEPHLNDVGFWSLDEFRSWSRQVLAVIRELRNRLSEAGSLEWRIRASEQLEINRASFPLIWGDLQANNAKDHLNIS